MFKCGFSRPESTTPIWQAARASTLTSRTYCCREMRFGECSVCMWVGVTVQLDLRQTAELERTKTALSRSKAGFECVGSL